MKTDILRATATVPWNDPELGRRRKSIQPNDLGKQIIKCSNDQAEFGRTNYLLRYLMGNKVSGIEISPETAKALALADQTMSEGRVVIHKGAGNHSTAPGLDLFFLRSAIDNFMQEAPFTDYVSSYVASALFTNTGFCGEHAAMSYFLHLPKLKEGERLYIITSKTMCHAWVELELANKERIVLDTWAKGPAVFRRDFSYANPADEETEIEFSHQELNDRVAANMAFLKEHFTIETQNILMAKYKQDLFEDSEFLGVQYPPEKSTLEEFDAQYRQMMGRKSLQEKLLSAVSVLRSTGASVKEATDLVNQNKKTSGKK